MRSCRIHASIHGKPVSPCKHNLRLTISWYLFEEAVKIESKNKKLEDNGNGLLLDLNYRHSESISQKVSTFQVHASEISVISELILQPHPKIRFLVLQNDTDVFFAQFAREATIKEKHDHSCQQQLQYNLQVNVSGRHWRCLPGFIVTDLSKASDGHEPDGTTRRAA